MVLYLILNILFVLTLVSATAEYEPAIGNHSLSYCNTTSRFSELTQGGVCSTPAVIFFGQDNGDLVRCLYDDPAECEVFHSAGSAIVDVHIIGDYIYAALREHGDILKCQLNVKNSCKTIYSCHSTVFSLSSGGGRLYIGLRGQVLSCDSNGSCKRMLNIYDPVSAIIQYGKYIFLGLEHGEMRRCNLTAPSSDIKRMFGMENSIQGFANFRKKIYAVSYGKLWDCSPYRRNRCQSISLQFNQPFGVAAFKNSLYVHFYDKGICKMISNTCVSHGNHKNAWSMALAYATYPLQDRFKTESTICTDKSNCQLVTYYDQQARAAFEVYVENGKLYNAEHSLVDTSTADEGTSGPAAIFVMGPGGKILLSNTHGGQVHTSSLFAGSPVAGAGEMVVEAGVIKRIRACSEHYSPDLELNMQVIQSLKTHGYTENIISETC